MAKKSYENPLLSHKRLREIYAALLDARTLRTSAAQAQNDAALISVAIGLRDAPEAGDVVSAGARDQPIELALGLSLKAMAKGATSPQRGSAPSATLSALERAYFTLGLATRLPAGALALAFIPAPELSGQDAKDLFRETSRLNPPLLLIVLPGSRTGSDESTGFAELAVKLDLPGIPVDAADPIALYRVAQECLGRARAGGGAAVIEAVRFPGAPDALAMLRRQIVARGAATERWCDQQAARRASA